MVENLLSPVELIDDNNRRQSRIGDHVWLWSGLGVVVLILLDQSSKIWASQVSLVSLNQGMAFGINLPPNMLILLTMLLLFGVSWGWWQMVKQRCNGQILTKNQSLQLIGYSVILAGGISNLIDRMIFGGVKDWLPIPLTPLNNNLADWMIVVGCIGLVWSIMLSGRHVEPPTSSPFS